MKKVFLMVLALLMMSSVAFAAAQKIAVVPYLDTVEQNKEYIGETIDEGYTNRFAELGLTVVPKAAVEKALDNAGYDVSNQMLPDKDILAAVAGETGADYVVALELADLKSSRHMSYFSSKVSTTTKLKYHFYRADTGKMTAFQTTASNNNKAVMVGMRSYKSSIEAALAEALEKGNDKIKSIVGL